MNEKVKFAVSLFAGSAVIAAALIFKLTMKLEDDEDERAVPLAVDGAKSWIAAREREAGEVPEDWPSAGKE